jgi:hypothetical protein
MTHYNLVTESKLADMALNAATSLDTLRRNSAANIDSVKEFLGALSTYSGSDGQDAPARALALDPVNNTIFAKALASADIREVKTVSDVDAELKRLVTDFSDKLATRDATKKPDDLFLSLYSFCLSVYDMITERGSLNYVEIGVFDDDNGSRSN